MTEKTSQIAHIVGTLFAYTLLGAFIAIVLLLPFLFLWSLNTLFSFNIPLSVDTYLASILILFFLEGISTLHLIRELNKSHKTCECN